MIVVFEIFQAHQNLRPDQLNVTSSELKKVSKNYLQFFSSENWDSVLFKSDTWGAVDGLVEAVFLYLWKMSKWNFFKKSKVSK